MFIKTSRLKVWLLTVIAVMAVGVWAQGPAPLGLSDRDARQNFLDSISNGYPSIGMAGKAFVALPVAARVTAIDALFAWMKVCTNSAAFKTTYAQSRDNRKPTPPKVDGTVDDELKKKQDEQTKGLEDSRKALAMLPADQRAQMEAMFTQMQAQTKDPAMQAMLRAGIEAERKRDQENYDSDLKKWQRDYPVDPGVLVARRLQAFLKLSADVDFSAKLVTQSGHNRFADQAFESKSSDWKMCFRAGKEAVTEARTAATNWLKELPQQ